MLWGCRGWSQWRGFPHCRSRVFVGVVSSPLQKPSVELSKPRKAWSCKGTVCKHVPVRLSSSSADALALLTGSSGCVLEGVGKPVIFKSNVSLDSGFGVVLLPQEWPRYCWLNALRSCKCVSARTMPCVSRGAAVLLRALRPWTNRSGTPRTASPTASTPPCLRLPAAKGNTSQGGLICRNAVILVSWCQLEAMFSVLVKVSSPGNQRFCKHVGSAFRMKPASRLSVCSWMEQKWTLQTQTLGGKFRDTG